MDRKSLGVASGITIAFVVIAAIMLSYDPASVTDSEPVTLQTNEKIGLVINSPNQSVSLEQVNQIYTDASSSGIGRSNVYLFWNILEPNKGQYDWRQSDVLMGFNEKNDLKVTLFFSVINGERLGPFPDWIGKPSINAIGEDRLVDVLDAILSRYHIIDTVIIAGETESQFRYNEQNIPVYKKLFSTVYDQIKEKHPDVKFGNSFGLHHAINKNLQHIVTDLSIGDFAAFSYSPTDSINEINKTPQEAQDDLEMIFEIVPDQKVGLFEISWSTSDFVNGDSTSQDEFMVKLFEFYSDNEEEIEFLTWYRYYDRPEGTCAAEQQKIGEESVVVEGSAMGGTEFTIERLNYYICNSGLIDVDGNEKSGWNEFKNQIQLQN